MWPVVLLRGDPPATSGIKQSPIRRLPLVLSPRTNPACVHARRKGLQGLLSSLKTCPLALAQIETVNSPSAAKRVNRRFQAPPLCLSELIFFLSFFICFGFSLSFVPEANANQCPDATRFCLI